MDRIEAMRAFVQVVDSGSFTQAALALGRHKATVSDQVKQLEARLGVRLLVRTTRTVTPTAEGLAYCARAAAILQQLDEAEAGLRRSGPSPAGRLRVEVPVALGRLVLMPEVRSFLEQYPRIELDLGCSDRSADLVREGIDCALRGGDLPDSGLVGRRIGAVPFVLCAAPRYADAHGLPAQPQDLAAHRRVGYRAPARRALPDVVLQRGGRQVAVPVPARLVTNDSGAVLAAGLDGLGIVQIAEFVAAHHLASGALLRVLPAWQCPALPLHLLTPGTRHRPARVQVFIDWVQGVLARRLVG